MVGGNSPLVEKSNRRRRKIAQACDQCRTRKIRCNGAKPVCEECSQRSNQKTRCRYSLSQDKEQRYSEYVSSLLDRIEELESQDRPFENSRHVFVPAVDLATSKVSQHNVEQHYSIEEERSLPTQTGASVGQSSMEHTSPVDAMGASAAAASTGESNVERFYGKSSLVSLMRQAYQTINSNRAISKTAPQQQMSLPIGTDQQINSLSGFELLKQFSLPPRSFADSALDSYWTKVHNLYPFLHKPTFLIAYTCLWLPELTNDPALDCCIDMLGSGAYASSSVVFHCALNLMLALGIQFMDISVEERDKLGQYFADKARGLCNLDFFDDGSLAAIQTLLIMTQFLQSTPFPNKCWNCIGITCRLAQGLGLHCEPLQTQRNLSLLEVEMRRRVWHGCVMLDTVVSMTLGRPLMLYAFRQVPFPNAVNDEDLASTESSPMDTSHMHFYIASLRAYQVLADVAEKVYGKANVQHVIHEKDVSLQTLFGNIAHIDLDLSKIENALPDHLDPTRHTPQIRNSSLYQQQVYALQARMSHIRVLLYLPIFTRHCQKICAKGPHDQGSKSVDPVSTELSLVITQAATRACVENAMKLIDVVLESLTAAAAEAWWYNLLYLRTASVVVLLSMAHEATYATVGLTSLQTSWSKCQHALEKLQAFSTTSSMCLQELQQLHEQVTNFQTGHANAARSINGDDFGVTNLGHSTHEASMDDIALGLDGLIWPLDSETSLFDNLFRFTSQ